MSQKTSLLAILVIIIVIFPVGLCTASDSVVFDFDGKLDAESRLPEPWTMLGHPVSDPPKFTVEEDPDQGKVLRMHAVGNQADAVRWRKKVSLKKTPEISFSWKVEKHPKSTIGNGASDQAVKVQLDFGRYGFKHRVLSYIFDPKAKVGTWHDDSSYVAKNRALVLDSGEDKLNTWIAHKRNVVADYRSQYKNDPPKLLNIVIFCDSNHSDSESVGYCSKIEFSSGSQ